MAPKLCVWREYAAANINAVVNHPEVRPWVGGGLGPLDLTELVANPHNVLLMGRGGGLFFVKMGPGRYEVHTQFLPDARGENAVAVAKDALRFMFTHTDAVELLTKVPDGNSGAKGLVRAIHGKLRFRRENAWQGANGVDGIGFYALTIQDWAGQCAEIEPSGEWFHDKLETAKTEGHGAPLHDHDPAHDRYVGATVEMVLAGQIEKALAFYNEWAPFAGYGPVALVAVNPPVIDIGDALLAVRPDDFEVLMVR